MENKLKHFTKEEIEELRSIFVERHCNRQEDISQEFNVHVHSTWPSIWPDITPTTDRPTCPKCDLVLENVMMYVCMNEGCPTGLGSLNC